MVFSSFQLVFRFVQNYRCAHVLFPRPTTRLDTERSVSSDAIKVLLSLRLNFRHDAIVPTVSLCSVLSGSPESQVRRAQKRPHSSPPGLTSISAFTSLPSIQLFCSCHLKSRSMQTAKKHRCTGRLVVSSRSSTCAQQGRSFSFTIWDGPVESPLRLEFCPAFPRGRAQFGNIRHARRIGLPNRQSCWN